MQFKFIIPRVSGDDAIFDNVFKANIPNIESEVFSVFDEPDKKYSIFAKYNKAIEELVKKGLSDDSIIIFCHNDVGILDNQFCEKLELAFNKTNSDLVGVVGTRELKEHCCWWQSVPQMLVGHIIQGAKEKKYMEGSHLIKGQIGFFDDVVFVDGLFMAVRGNVFNNPNIRFRTDIFSDNHFYDASLCLDLLLNGYNVSVIDLLVYHKSQGAANNNDVWTIERDKFIKYYTGLGLTFPLDKTTIKNYIEKNKPQPVNDSVEVMEFKL